MTKAGNKLRVIQEKITEQTIRQEEVTKTLSIADAIEAAQQRIEELGQIKVSYINKIDQLKKELQNSEITLHVIDGVINEHRLNLDKWK
jgi:enterochelin esterase-like enzyme